MTSPHFQNSGDLPVHPEGDSVFPGIYWDGEAQSGSVARNLLNFENVRGTNGMLTA
jgi:hypothetical protein